MEREIRWLKREVLGDDDQRHSLAHQLGVPFITLAHSDIALEALLAIPEPLAREYNAVGYALNGHTLEVALLNLDDMEHLGFLEARYRVLPRLTTADSLRGALRHYQRHLYQTYGSALEREESPNLLDTLLRHALAAGASDVHLEQGAEGFLIRYRIRGVLRDAMALSGAAGKNIMSTLRGLAGLSGGALPHEARVRVDLGYGEDIAVRVSTVPLLQGEKMVMSIVREKARRGYTLEGLGFHGEALERVHRSLLRRSGLITIAGPGSSTLLYTLLDMLNTPECSVATVERAVAHTLPRVAQADLGQTGLSMGAVLRGVLRSDPDIVGVDSVGEQEVAVLAAAAGKRGVLVVAVLDDALLLPNADVSIKTALLRKLCSKHFLDTRKLTRLENDTLESGAQCARVLGALKEEGRVAKDAQWKDLQFPRAIGCSECEGGYNGLIGIQEVSVGGEVLGLNLVEDGLFKAHQGLTDIKEVEKLLF